MSKGSETRYRIIQAIEDELKEKDYSEITLTDIANRAGVTPSLISYHVKSIDNAVQMLITKQQDEVIGQIYDLRTKDPLVYLFAADLLITYNIYSQKNILSFRKKYLSSTTYSNYSTNEAPKIMWDALYYEIFRIYNCELPDDVFKLMRIKDSATRKEMNLLIDYDSLSTPKEFRRFCKNLVYCGSGSLLLVAGMNKEIVDQKFKQACKIADEIQKDKAIG